MLSGKRSDLQQFKDWLTANAAELKDRTPTEIVELAIAAGFNPVNVRQWETSQRFREMGGPKPKSQTPSELTEEDFTRWVRNNRMNFIMHSKQYTPDAIVELAIAVGFPRELATRRMSDFKWELSGADQDDHMRRATNWTCAEINKINNPIDLQESWQNLALYLMEGIDFED